MRACSVLCAFLAAAIFAIQASAVQSDGGAKPEPGIRTVYLVRHGQYDHTDRRDSTVGRGLVPLGVAQARLVGARLRSLPVDMTSLHSSTMTRARETAAVIGEEFPGLELQISPLLSECTPSTSPKTITGEIKTPDLKACEKRLDQAFSNYLLPSLDGEQHDVVVCHGNMIRYLVMKALGVNSKRWYSLSIANCSLTVVKITPSGAMSVLSFSDTGHLPPNLTTRTFPSVSRDLAVPVVEVELATVNGERPK